jgi:hypothetical protein
MKEPVLEISKKLTVEKQDSHRKIADDFLANLR